MKYIIFPLIFLLFSYIVYCYDVDDVGDLACSIKANQSDPVEAPEQIAVSNIYFTGYATYSECKINMAASSCKYRYHDYIGNSTMDVNTAKYLNEKDSGSSTIGCCTETAFNNSLIGTSSYSLTPTLNDSSWACCPNRNMCVYEGNCYESVLNPANLDDNWRNCFFANNKGLYCNNGAIDLQDANANNIDDRCETCLNGSTRVNGTKRANVWVQDLYYYPFQNISYLPGDYRLCTFKGNRTFRATYPGVLPDIEQIVVNTSLPKYQDFNFSLNPGINGCKPDCTSLSSDNKCDASCQGLSGCLFNSTQTLNICDGKPKDFELPYNASFNVVCCNNGPVFKNYTRVNMTFNASNVLTIEKQVWYHGKLIRMIISTFE